MAMAIKAHGGTERKKDVKDISNKHCMGKTFQPSDNKAIHWLVRIY